MDITTRLSEKVVHRDFNGLYQTEEIGIELSEKDVPADKVREKTLALRLQCKRFIVNTKLKEGLITPEQGVQELNAYQETANAK